MIVKSSKAYSIAIAGFVFAATLFFRIRDRITITILPQFTTQMFTTINVKKVVVVALMKLSGNIVSTINTGRNTLTARASEIGKLFVDMVSYHPIVFISSAIQKITLTLMGGRLGLTISPILASFFILGDYDPTTLGTQDVKTLGAMDYTT